MDEFGNGPTPPHHASVIQPDHLAFALAFLSGVIGAIMIVTNMRGVPEKSIDGAKYEVLLDWVKINGGEINENIVIQKSSQGCGFGAFTNGEVKKDDIIFEIPRKACLTLDAAINDDKFGQAFKNLIEKAGPGGNTVVMAGYMAKEYLLAKEDANGSSAWSPYFDTLPWERGINNQEHVLFWPEEKIDELLVGSTCDAEARSLRDEVGLATDIMYKVLGPSIRVARGEDVDEGGFNINRMLPWMAKPPTPEEPPEGFPEAMKGAFVCLLTRAFQDDNEEDGGNDEEKLVPLLDMLQHSDTPNVSHAMRKADGTVEVRARCDIPTGTELFNQYRSEEEETMPYSRFFTRFGFVPGISEDMENLFVEKSSIFYPQKAEI
ncbi:MAG: hypothetical protein SGBAC_001740 [Bacillariaceae sp.]